MLELLEVLKAECYDSSGIKGMEIIHEDKKVSDE